MSKKLFLLGGAATMTAIGGGMFYYNKWMPHEDATPGDSFVDEDGNTWTMLKDDALMEQFGIADQEVFDGGVELDGAETFPAHFWTAANDRGLNYGDGTAPGRSFVVFKSVKNGKYMS